MTERNVMQQQAYFVYEKKEQGICILRCYAKESRVVVPEEIEGLPVTEIAPYAFAADMEKEPKNPGELPCICGELLEELVLPGTVERIGRYVFYNCRYFREFTFGANIRYMGAGAFTGCKRLSKLHVRDMGQEKSCLREVLVDLNQTVTVEWLGKDGFQVLYPAFFEEAVENTPARIIETHTHGVGIQYRNAFRNTQIDWEEYDRLFEIGRHNMEPEEAVYASAYRLKRPLGLKEEAAQSYENFLREHMERAAELFQREGETELLRWLAEEFVHEKSELEVLMKAVAGDAAAVSMMMDISKRRFSIGKKKGFSL